MRFLLPMPDRGSREFTHTKVRLERLTRAALGRLGRLQRREATAAAAVTEAQLQEAVRDLARIRGWMFFHPYDSRKSTPGFPDLVLVHPRTEQLIVAELKSARGQLTDAQKQWIEALYRAGLDVRVWRPEDLTGGQIARALTPTAIRTVPA